MDIQGSRESYRIVMNVQLAPSRGAKLSGYATNMNSVATDVEDLSEETRSEIANSFVRLRFRGGRFEGDGGMPLAALGELQAVDELIQALSKFMWRRSHGRRRMRTYPPAPVLRVSRFARGSSIPLIERDGNSSVLTDDPYDASRDLFEKTFRSIISEQIIPEEFPVELYDQLRRIGKSLKEDEEAEFLEIDADGVWSANSLTRGVRSDFWEVLDQRQVVSRILVGHVQSMTWPSSFEFIVHNGQRLSGKAESHWDDVYKALGTMDSHKFCRLYVGAEVDYRNRIRKITSVKSVEVFEMEPKGWEERFLLLASCEKDEDVSSAVVVASALERTDTLVKEAEAEKLSRPAIFPSSDGGTALVWSFSEGRVTIYVEEDEKFEVELVPHGPLKPFSTNDPKIAISKVREFIDG